MTRAISHSGMQAAASARSSWRAMPRIADGLRPDCARTTCRGESAGEAFARQSSTGEHASKKPAGPPNPDLTQKLPAPPF